MLFSSLAGVFVDRWNRKRTMIAADLLRAVLLLPMLLVSTPESLITVYIVGFLQALISLFFFPAKGAVIPLVVANEDLVAENSLNGIGDTFLGHGSLCDDNVLTVWAGADGKSAAVGTFGRPDPRASSQ